MKRKINVGILLGGKSTEHEISLQSARNIIEAVDKDKYNPVIIGIDKLGNWHLYDKSTYLLNADNISLIQLNEPGDNICFLPQCNGKVYNLNCSDFTHSVDVVFPVLHGPFGEDGTIQGLLKLANVPFVGAGVLGSAVGMDKDIMKRLLREAKIPTPKFIALKDHEKLPLYDHIVKELGAPFFVKPARLGSSVGVNKVTQECEYRKSIEEAFAFDDKILFEENIMGREIECAVLGNNNPIVSVPVEIVFTNTIYSYETKYIDEGTSLEIPAKLSEEVKHKIQQMAIDTFKVLSCGGLGRVDFFLKDNDDVLVNEINTMPGFAEKSTYPKVWKTMGIEYPELIDRLIQTAFEKFENEKNLKLHIGKIDCYKKGVKL